MLDRDGVRSLGATWSAEPYLQMDAIRDEAAPKSWTSLRAGWMRMEYGFQNDMKAVSRPPSDEEERSWLGTRLSGPGGLYNLGNLIALLSGFALSLYGAWGQETVFEVLHGYLVGSSGAAALTLALVVFLISGEIYHHAARPNALPTLLPWADLISGLAAIALTMALLWLGEAMAAWVAGVMLVTGKLGSAALPVFGMRNWARLARLLRLTVVASRLPSLASLGRGVLTALRGEVPLEDVLLPSIMILCFLLWLWADLLLLLRDDTLRLRRAGPA